MEKKTIKLSETEFKEMVADAVKETIKKMANLQIREGVTFDNANDSFAFDFKNDNETDIIRLTKVGYQITAFNHCYYYGYEFEKNTDSTLRTQFIHSLKFPDGKISDDDKKQFIRNAVDSLDSDISLPQYKLIVYPESMSEINRDLLKYLNRFASPDITTIELIKSLPSKIEFDYNRFRMEVLNSVLPNGRNRYTEAQKAVVLQNIQSMMDDIHSLNYFSIARNVKKNKYRQYIRNYYTFKNDSDRQLYEAIINTNVLIIDDIVTSGTTLSHILNCLRSVNDTNNIVIFSLIGKEID